MVDRTGFQVGVCHSERFFNFEQLPVEPDDLLCGEIISVGFVAFDPGQRIVLVSQCVVDLLVRSFQIHIPVAFDWDFAVDGTPKLLLVAR